MNAREMCELILSCVAYMILYRYNLLYFNLHGSISIVSNMISIRTSNQFKTRYPLIVQQNSNMALNPLIHGFYIIYRHANKLSAYWFILQA